MKCKKCGADVPEGSRFCNECGAKIEQIVLPKGSEPKSTESYKCEKCSTIIPSNSVFCPECHAYQSNNFKPDNKSITEPEKSLDKKPIYRTSHFYIALIIALILCVTAVIAISQVSQSKSQQSETTSPDKTVQDIAKTNSLKLYNMTPFSISVPEKWEHKTIDGCDYFYGTNGDMLYINTSETSISQSQFNSDYVDSFLDGFADSLDDFEEIDRTETYIDDFFAYRVTADIEEFGNKFYGTIYMWVTNNYSCSVIFSSKGDKQSEEFNLYENTIMESIVIDTSKDVSPTEEKLTKKATELETEPPTKKTTEPETKPSTKNSSNSEPEPNTSEMVDYISEQAKADSKNATDEDVQEAVDWLKNNKYNYFSGNDNMEKTMYYGFFLEDVYSGTGNDYEKLGFQAYKTVKYVYRGYESIQDESTRNNLEKLRNMVDAL